MELTEYEICLGSSLSARPPLVAHSLSKIKRKKKVKNICVYIHMFIYMYIYTYLHVYTHIYMCVHIKKHQTSERENGD